jgi:mannose-6-phosphate isomerase
LLFKYLDAREDLSIQVHPNDELAKKHHSFGKTECGTSCKLMMMPELLGSKKIECQYIENLENKTLFSILDDIKVKSGDVFF